MTRTAPMPRQRKPMKRSPMRRFSAKARNLISGRRACCAAVNERSGGRCEVKGPTCTGGGEHVHEKLSRAQGGDITDENNCLHVCLRCHNAIHNFPKWAAEKGFTISKKYEQEKR